MREDRAKYNKNHPKRKTNQPKLQRSNNSIAPTFGQSKQDERNRELRQIHRRAIASAMNALQIASEIDQLINE
jgi:hypothetical protein